MLIARLKMIALVLTGVAAGLGTGALSHRALADKPKPEIGPSIAAVVVSVDAGKHTIAVTVPAEDGKKERVEKTFALGRDLKVVLEHGLTKETKEGKLADLTADTPVSLRLSSDQKTVLHIAVHGGSLHGSVKAVDAERNTLTLAGKDKNGAFEKTLPLAKEARVLLDDGLVKNGAKGDKLADLTEGTPVLVHLSGYDRKTVIAVHAHGPSLHGSLKGIDAGTNTITITVKEDGALVDKTFDLAKGVKVDGGKLDELTAGTVVSVQLSVFDKKKVVHIRVHKDNGE